MTSRYIAAFAALSLLASPLSAAAGEIVLAQADTMSEGEVTKVDTSAKKITIKHGPLENLEMPGMTMVFAVADEAMLDQVAPGDQIKFVAERVRGQITVTEIAE